MESLVGQTVRLSPQNRRDGGNNTKTLKIVGEISQEGKRMYQVQNTDTKVIFVADALIYDQHFLRKKSKILPENTKGNIYNTGNPNYNISQKV